MLERKHKKRRRKKSVIISDDEDEASGAKKNGKLLGRQAKKTSTTDDVIDMLIDESGDKGHDVIIINTYIYTMIYITDIHKLAPIVAIHTNTYFAHICVVYIDSAPWEEDSSSDTEDIIGDQLASKTIIDVTAVPCPGPDTHLVVKDGKEDCKQLKHPIDTPPATTSKPESVPITVLPPKPPTSTTRRGRRSNNKLDWKVFSYTSCVMCMCICCHHISFMQVWKSFFADNDIDPVWYISAKHKIAVNRYKKTNNLEWLGMQDICELLAIEGVRVPDVAQCPALRNEFQNY